MSKLPSNYLSEWYGVRLYPIATGAGSPHALKLFESQQCPFLTRALERPTICIKNSNSKGVCTITTTKGKSRDWIVCPYRVLEPQIILEVTRKIFSDDRDQVRVFPVVHLEEEERRKKILRIASNETVYLFFQDKLGGEINLSKTETTPELSFDITILECVVEDEWLVLKRYGLFEVQTMDFHGSYGHAVKALESAIDLHRSDFEQQLKRNPEWAGRKIEGPNIANVFKRTVYQLILKFELAGKDRCAGVVLGLPQAVWESWSPHFGGLEWADQTQRKWNESEGQPPNSWILVFTPREQHDTAHWKMTINKEIQLGAKVLVQRAFEVVPSMLSTQALPRLSESIVQRTRKLYKNTRLSSD